MIYYHGWMILLKSPTLKNSSNNGNYSGASTKSKKSDICWKFDNGICTHNPYKFQHRCNHCGKMGHGANRCLAKKAAAKEREADKKRCLKSLFNLQHLVISVAIDEDILWAENKNLSNIVTPIDVNAFDFLLQDTEYMEDERNFITNGFRFGFSLGYDELQIRQSTARNIKLRCSTLTRLWNKIMKEVKLGCFAGLFETVPFDNYIQSPIGLSKH